MSDTIRVSIELADAAAQAALNDFITKGDKADKGLKKLGESGKGSFNDITVGIGKSIGVYEIFEGNLLANLATKAFETITEAAGELFHVLVTEGIKAAQESEAAINSLNTALGISGHYSAEASKDFQEFAKEIQRTTAFEDDAVIKNAALIESLTQLDTNGLKRATKAAIELSSALGRDLASTSEAVSKAANGNYTAINKMGVQFDTTGGKAQVFQNALAAIEAKFGGTAASKINTFTGALAQTKNNFNDLQESIGNIIIQNPVFVETLKAVNEVIFDTTKNVEGATGAMGKVGQAFLFITALTGQVVEVFNGLATAAVIVFDSVVSVATRTMQVLVAPFAAFSETAQKYYAAYKQQADDSARDIGDTLVSGGPLNGIVAAINKIGEGAALGFEKLSSGAKATVTPIKNTKSAITELADEAQRLRDENNKYVESLAKEANTTKSFYEEKLQALNDSNAALEAAQTTADIQNFDEQLVREDEFYLAKSALLDQALQRDLQKIQASTVSPEIKHLAELEAQRKFNIESDKLSAEHEKSGAGIRKKSDETRVSDQRSTLNTIATLQTSHNQTLATIGKAAAISTATIDGYLAVQKALASFPPPFNFAAAALVGVATAANVANIAGVQFEEGGIVPGHSFTGDQVQARVNSGEMILNRQQQAQLFEVANGKSSSGSGITRADLAAFADAIMSKPTVVQVDGRELFNFTRNQLNSGRAF